MIKKVFALVLVLALCLGGTLSASATDMGGTVGLKVPLYSTVVPANFNFAIDPIEIAKGGQLYCGDNGFVFANKSALPVMLNCEVTMTPKAGVTLVTNASDVDQTTMVTTEKEIFLAIQAATSATTTKLADASIAATDVKAGYATVATTIVPMAASAGNTKSTLKFSFLLNEGIDVNGNDYPTTGSGDAADNTVKDEKSLAAFRFYAAMTTYNKNWAADDLSFEGTYDFQGVRATDYASAISGNKIVAGTHNMFANSGSAALTIGFLNDAGTANIAGGFTKSIVKTTTTDVLVPFYFNGKTISTITWADGGFTLPAAQYTISGNNIKFLMNNATFALRSSASGNKSVVVKLDDNSTHNFVIALS